MVWRDTQRYHALCCLLYLLVSPCCLDGSLPSSHPVPGQVLHDYTTWTSPSLTLSSIHTQLLNDYGCQEAPDVPQAQNPAAPPAAAARNRSCPPADAGGCTDAEPLCYAASTMPGVLLKAIILSAYARAVLELIVSGSMGCKSPCSVCLCLMFHPDVSS